ncbi:MAG: hypothetical protein LC808_27290 [Actinobacteria bacterium]|nr:hypothetical protein [Actinomycetota bacterium]
MESRDRSTQGTLGTGTDVSKEGVDRGGPRADEARNVLLVQDEFDQLGITAQTMLEARNRFYPGWWLYPDDTDIGRLSVPLIEVDNLWDFILAKAARPKGVEGRVVYRGMSANLALLLNREAGHTLMSDKQEPDSWHASEDVYAMASTILGFTLEECDLFEALVSSNAISLTDVATRLPSLGPSFVGNIVQSGLARLEVNWLFPTAAAVALRQAVSELSEGP